MALTTIETPPVSGDELLELGGARCLDRSVMLTVGTSGLTPIEGVGEWTQAALPGELDVVYRFTAAETEQSYAAVNRVVAVVSGFRSVDDAAAVTERIRSGVNSTCVGERTVGVGLPGGVQEAKFNGELVAIENLGDEAFAITPVVVTASGATVRNSFRLGVARFDSVLIFVTVVDAGSDPNLEPAGLLAAMSEAIPAQP